MSKRRRDFLEDKKILTLIGIGFVVLIIGCIFFFNKDKKEKVEEENITKLTEEYNKNHNTKTTGISWEDNNTSNYEEDEEDKEETEEMKENKDTEIITDTEEKQEFYKIADIEKLDDTNAQREADDFALFLSEKINNKSYDDLYNILNKEYVKDFSYTKDKFEFKYSFIQGVYVEVTNIKFTQSKDRLIVTTKFIDKSDGSFRIEDFTIFKDGTIADIPIYFTADLPHETEIDNVIYKINRRYDTRLGAIYNIEIENNSDKLIKIEDMLIKDGDVIYSYEIVSDNTILESYPGIPFKFMIKLPNNHDIDYLMLKCIDFNEKPYDITILDK